jgi:Zn-dependent peptidase ImmA (M78 family)
MAAALDREIAAARTVATAFRSAFEGAAPVPTPVDDIAESLFSLRIIEDHAMTESGTLDPAISEVRVNATECAAAPLRRRFTIAHEIGHLVLHAPGGTAAVFCRVTDPLVIAANRIEREANRFAAELLMPEDLVRAEAARVGPDRAALADLFQVSAPAMGWRLLNLGLATSRPDQSA